MNHSIGRMTDGSKAAPERSAVTRNHPPRLPWLNYVQMTLGCQKLTTHLYTFQTSQIELKLNSIITSELAFEQKKP